MAYQPLDSESLARLLKSTRLGKPVSCYGRVTSTNAIAHEIARADCPEGAVVIADSQSRGRGRLGRDWESPAGTNLYLSLVLRPRMRALEAAKLTLLAAVAVADTMRPFLQFAPRIKWPNDILLRGRKASGILCELAAEEENVSFVVVGVGVNLNCRRHAMSPAIRDIATSVMEESGCEVDRTVFAAALIEHFEARYLRWQDCGFDAVAEAWNRYARIEGQWMCAQVGGRIVTGRARGLDENGFLVLETNSGATETVIAGEVSLLEAPPTQAGTRRGG